MGIDEVEALAHEGLFVVEDHTVQVDEGLRVDKHADVLEVEDAVTVAGLGVETDIVGEPGAASALNAETQAAFGGRDALLGHGDADALEGAIRHLDSLLRGSLIFGIQYCQMFC